MIMSKYKSICAIFCVSVNSRFVMFPEAVAWRVASERRSIFW